MFSKKATKIDKIFTVDLTPTTSTVKISSIFVALENMNFTEFTNQHFYSTFQLWANICSLMPKNSSLVQRKTNVIQFFCIFFVVTSDMHELLFFAVLSPTFPKKHETTFNSIKLHSSQDNTVGDCYG